MMFFDIVRRGLLCGAAVLALPHAVFYLVIAIVNIEYYLNLNFISLLRFMILTGPTLLLSAALLGVSHLIARSGWRHAPQEDIAVDLTLLFFAVFFLVVPFSVSIWWFVDPKGMAENTNYLMSGVFGGGRAGGAWMVFGSMIPLMFVGGWVIVTVIREQRRVDSRVD